MSSTALTHSYESEYYEYYIMNVTKQIKCDLASVVEYKYEF